MLPINSLLNGVLLRDNNLERDSQQMATGAESVSDCPRTRILLSLRSSTVEVVQYIGGITSVLWRDNISTVGDSFSTVGDSFSTVEVAQYSGR